MSLRCSLLGHSYGEAEIERDREEQGSEVVVTVREFEECERCGEQNVISENKEVTAIESPAPDLESAEADSDVGAGSDATGSAGATGTPGVSDSTDPDVSVEDDGAEIMTDSGDAGGSADAASPGGTSTSAARGDAAAETANASAGTADESVGTADESVGTAADASGPDEAATASTGGDLDDAQSAADDDGVILDDQDSDPSDGDRRPGEWPEAETTHPAEADEGGHADWPEVGQEDEGFDAEPGGESADVEFGGGLTPESAPEVDDGETDEVEFVNADGDALRARDAGTSEVELSSGISAGAEAPSLSGPADDPDVDAEFVCPECDYREAVSGSSLRAGDICPECSRGYLATE